MSGGNSKSRRAARAAAEAGALGTTVDSPAPALARPPAPPSFSFGGMSGARAPGVRAAPWSASGSAGAPAVAPAIAAPPAGTAASSPTQNGNGATNGHAYANGGATHPASNLPYVPALPPAPPPPAFTGDSYNEHAQASAAQQQRQQARPNAPVIQPSTQLVIDWARIVFAASGGHRLYNPQGLTIWLVSTDNPRYEEYIPGLSVVATQEGEHPARALHDAAQRIRHYPDRAEHFVGRIEMHTTDGRSIQVGGGFLDLAPLRAEAPPAPHQYPPQYAQQHAPNYAAPPPYGYGAPPGYPPPYGYGAPPGYPPPPPPFGFQPSPFGYGAPAYGAAAAGMLPYFAPIGAPHIGAPPASVQKDPSAMEQWAAMQRAANEGTRVANESQYKLMEMAFSLAKANQAPAQSGGGAPTADQMFDKVLDWSAKLRGLEPQTAKEPGRTTILDADGTKLVLKPDGEVDHTASGIINLVKEGREMISARTQAAVAARAAAGNGGTGPGLSTARAPGVKNGGAR